MKKKNDRSNAIKMSGSTIVFNVLGYAIMIIAGLICLLPFAFLLSASFTAERSIAVDGFSLIPKEVSTDAYALLFRHPQDIWRAYGVSGFITVVGSITGLTITSMTAYVLSRKYLRYRYQITFFFYFTTLFSGGLLSVYILFVRYLGLKNNYLALILPMLVNVFYLLIMRSFISSIPDSIFESAKIDGAGEMTIFIRLVLPLSTSSLATIGLFLVLDYWNDWYNAMLYISDYKKFPLQYMLYNMLSASEALARLSKTANVNAVEVPSRAVRMAMTVVATGPILLVYPFVQRFFVKGVTLGAVKG